MMDIKSVYTKAKATSTKNICVYAVAESELYKKKDIYKPV